MVWKMGKCVRRMCHFEMGIRVHMMLQNVTKYFNARSGETFPMKMVFFAKICLHSNIGIPNATNLLVAFQAVKVK